jgi:hypothetical protein
MLNNENNLRFYIIIKNFLQYLDDYIILKSNQDLFLI